MPRTELAKEWTLLQNQFDSYEKFSLIIKLTALSITTVILALNATNTLILLMISAFWLQDAIWKTFQARIGERLQRVEQSLERADESITLPAYQFNLEYLKNRQRGLGLFKEYLLQALRPTVAYPYLILSLIIFYAVIGSNGAF